MLLPYYTGLGVALLCRERRVPLHGLQWLAILVVFTLRQPVAGIVVPVVVVVIHRFRGSGVVGVGSARRIYPPLFCTRGIGARTRQSERPCWWFGSGGRR